MDSDEALESYATLGAYIEYYRTKVGDNLYSEAFELSGMEANAFHASIDPQGGLTHGELMSGATMYPIDTALLALRLKLLRQQNPPENVLDFPS